MDSKLEDQIWKVAKVIQNAADVVRPRKFDQDGYELRVHMVLYVNRCSCSLAKPRPSECDSFKFKEVDADAPTCPECGTEYEPMMF